MAVPVSKTEPPGGERRRVSSEGDTAYSVKGWRGRPTAHAYLWSEVALVHQELHVVHGGGTEVLQPRGAETVVNVLIPLMPEDPIRAHKLVPFRQGSH